MKNLVAKCRSDIIEIYKHALEVVKPERIVKNSIAFENNSLVVKAPINQDNDDPIIYDLRKSRLHLIGGGKCALAMAQGVAEVANQARTNDLFSHGSLSVPIISKPLFDRDSEAQKLLKSIEVESRFGSENNLPDESSVLATAYMFDRIAEACRHDRDLGLRSLFIVLISGGGSACLTSPKYISLEQKSAFIKELVQKGADIVELNAVRRCFSNIKGGNLARKILELNPEAQIVSLIISDVINDPIEFIASGPTFLETRSERQVLTNIMRKYGLELPNKLDHLRQHDVNSRKDNVTNKVIGNNKLALRHVEHEAKRLGYHVKLLNDNLSGQTTEILEKLLKCLDIDENNHEKTLVVCGGEATVMRLPDENWGLGGRTQEMALDYMILKLTDISSPRHIDTFLAASTDGQDGPTDVAGSIASHFEWSLAKTFDLDLALKAKRNHDSYNFWTRYKPDWLIKTGPTGTNVMDLYILSLVKI